MLSKVRRKSHVNSPDDISEDFIEKITLQAPCKTLLIEGLKPIADYLQNQAVIKDMKIMEFDLQNATRNSILNLATAKGSYDFTVNHTWRKEFLFLQSDTEIEANVKADVTVGFDISNHFKMSVDHKNRLITIDLPEPSTLGKEVNLNFVNANEGVFSPELKSEMYNELNKMAKEKTTVYANNDNLYILSKNNANKAVMAIFNPLMALPQFDYKVYVTFNGVKIKSDEGNVNNSEMVK